MQNRAGFLCGNRPNCVSTQELRPKFAVAPFTLAPNVTSAQIERVALELPGAKVVKVTDNYVHIEYRSKIMGFIDDLELEIQGDHLIVRSASRVGYSDFGVNRRRVALLRQLLMSARLVV